MLQIRELVKCFGKFRAVDGLNLQIDKGKIFGFVGPNGAGKTTTMKIMTGLMTATSGNIFLEGSDLIKNPMLIKEKIGYMPDFFGVYDNLKVNEYMSFYADSYYIPIEDRKSLIPNLLEIVNLSDKENSYVDSLSRGMKQRLCLARSLIHDPEILVLDEPASGLDPRARIEMKEILKQLSDLGKTIIISSHILPELHQMCDEIGIINRGRVVAKGTVNEIMNQFAQKRQILVKYIENGNVLLRLLKEIPDVSEIKEDINELSFSFRGNDGGLAYILRTAIENGVVITNFSEKEGNLEDLFIKLTGNEVQQ